MKLYTFVTEGQERIGAENTDGHLVDLQHAAELREGKTNDVFSNMLALINGGAEALAETNRTLTDAPTQAIKSIDDIRIIAPLPKPRKLYGFTTFVRHLKQATAGFAWAAAEKEPDPEAAFEEIRKKQGLENLPGPGWYDMPGYFFMDATAITGADETVEWPRYSDWLDYELEIIAVIGGAGKNIAAGDAEQHIFGYTILNDLSARDAQLRQIATGSGVTGKGKDFDNANPMGPCIVTADELADPYNLDVSVSVNGEIWSQSSTRDPNWRFADCIAAASQSQTLLPGDLFSTGCIPDCCTLELKERKLKRGDTVELEAKGIGVLRTYII